MARVAVCHSAYLPRSGTIAAVRRAISPCEGVGDGIDRAVHADGTDRSVTDTHNHRPGIAQWGKISRIMLLTSASSCESTPVHSECAVFPSYRYYNDRSYLVNTLVAQYCAPKVIIRVAPGIVNPSQTRVYREDPMFLITPRRDSIARCAPSPITVCVSVGVHFLRTSQTFFFKPGLLGSRDEPPKLELLVRLEGLRSASALDSDISRVRVCTLSTLSKYSFRSEWDGKLSSNAD